MSCNCGKRKIVDIYKMMQKQKEVKEKLEYYESKLKLYHNRLMIEKLLDNDTFDKIEKYI